MTNDPSMPGNETGLIAVPAGVDTSNVPDEYLSQSYHDRVMKNVFGKRWLNIGRVEELPSGNGFIVKRLPFVPSGVLIVCGRDGEIRAFHNACPHRGNELVWQNKGVCQRAFSCKFHGWSFSDTGDLVNATDPETFNQASLASARLKPIALEIWRGFLFINLDNEPKETLGSFLGTFGERLAEYPFEKFSLYSRYTVTVNANWMVVADAFQEGYHSGALHGTWTNSDPKSRTLGVALSPLHRNASYSIPGRHPPKPFEKVILEFSQSGLYADRGEAEVRGLNSGKHDNFMFDHNIIHPNFFVDVSSRFYWTYNFWPEGQNQTRCEITTYYLPPRNYAEAVAVSYNRCRLLATQLEDLEVIERTQRGLKSGAIPSLILGQDEHLLRHFHEAIDRDVRED